MILVSSFVELVQPISPAMTAPTFKSFAAVLIGWVFACLYDAPPKRRPKQQGRTP